MKLSSAVFFIASASAQSVVDVVVGSEDHETLEAAVLAASPDIAQALSFEGATLTLFAPDDDAFDTLGDETVTRLTSPAWQPHLDCVLKAHVHGDAAIPSANITAETAVSSLQDGYVLNVAPDGDTVTVNQIPVTGADIQADNGVIHSISEGVLLPNCVTKNIVDQLQADGSHTTLIAAVQAADIVDVFTGNPTAEGMTLFAPTDAAFKKLPSAALEFLLKEENKGALTSVLQYHLIQQNVIPTESGEASPAFDGDKLAVTVEDGAITINDSKVTGTILASNGLIHTVDAVLVPPSLASALPTGDAMMDMPTASPPTDAMPTAASPTAVSPTAASPTASASSPTNASTESSAYGLTAAVSMVIASSLMLV